MTVAGSARARGRMRISTVAEGGSSRVLRNAWGASPVMRSASSRTNSFRGAITGRSAAWRSSSRIASMRIARAPFGFVSGGVGTSTWRSGCWRSVASRQARHTPHPARGQSSAWANASAVVIRPAPAGPTNAYACATRSVSSARRSSATARGWSRIASSATQELLDDRAHLRGDHVQWRGRAHEAHALGLRAPDLEVAPPYAPVEGDRLTLEAVAPPAADPPEPLDGIEVEEQREVGQDAAGRPDIQLADQVGVDAAPVALVRHGRVGVAVAEHDAAALEPRADLLCDVLVARGHEQEDLDERFGPDARTGGARRPRGASRRAHGSTRLCALWRGANVRGAASGSSCPTPRRPR